MEKRTLASKYRLECPLARGGMGSVWLARHLTLDVDVAVKLMAPEIASSRDARERFEREAKISASLRVPNAVHVQDYGIEDGTPYLVMELLDGEDVETRLRREGRLDGAAVEDIVLQVARGLRRAHDLGLVHRDLKPANIFLARQGADEIVKIRDFGIAKSTGPGNACAVTQTGALLGSPLYMSPEQIRRRKEVDHRSDLWSLGVIAFECLTGRPPFVGEDMGELLLAIATEDPPLASALVPGLGPGMDRFFARALSRAPVDRFQSADELAAALSRAVRSGPVSGSTTEYGSPPAAQATTESMSPPAALAATEHVSPPAPREGTLSPHGKTLSEPRARLLRGARLPALAAGAVALALAGVLLFRAFTLAGTEVQSPGPEPATSTAVEAAPPVVSPASTPPAAPSSSADPAVPSSSAGVPSSSADIAAPSSSADTAAPSSSVGAPSSSADIAVRSSSADAGAPSSGVAPAPASAAPARSRPGRVKPPSPPVNKLRPPRGDLHDADPTRHI